MFLIYLYIAFSISTAVVFSITIFRDALGQLFDRNPDNILVRCPKLAYLAIFLVTLVASPLAFGILFHKDHNLMVWYVLKGMEAEDIIS